MIPSPAQIKFSNIGLLLLLGIVFLTDNFAAVFHSVLKAQPSPFLFTVFPLLLSVALTTWTHYDSRLRGLSMGIDQGMYIFWAWPVTFPIYVIKSRGFRPGCLLLLALLGIYLLTLALAVGIVMTISVGSAMLSAG